VGFREPLDLGDIIPKYQWALEGGKPPPRVETYIETDLPEQRAPEIDESIPRRIGNGPEHCSSSVAVECIYPPAHCWDVNGWYRDLGANHRMSRKQLGQAYMEADGPESERLTWIMTALLDPEIKRAYDLTPLGDLYLDDPVILERLKALALKIARDKGIDPNDVLDEMGLRLVDSPQERSKNSPQNLLDSESIEDENVFNRDEWTYSFWVWNYREIDLWDYAQAEYWQESLISACARRGLLTRLRVGLMAGDDEYAVQRVIGTPVVFINRKTQITPDLADSAVEHLSTYL
jgi:hypothetical protein